MPGTHCAADCIENLLRQLGLCGEVPLQIVKHFFLRFFQRLQLVALVSEVVAGVTSELSKVMSNQRRRLFDSVQGRVIAGITVASVFLSEKLLVLNEILIQKKGSVNSKWRSRPVMRSSQTS